MTDPPVEKNGVLKADVTSALFEGTLIIQAIWATGSAAVIDAEDNELWVATAGGQGLVFENGFEVRGFKVASGTGDVYVYVRQRARS